MIALIATILPIAITATVLSLYYVSWSQTDISFTDLKLEASSSSAFLSDLQTYKKLRFTSTYEVVGGIFPVDCKDFTLNVELEDLDVGQLELDNFQISGERKANTQTHMLDLSSLSYNDLSYIIDKFNQYKSELKVDIEGSATIQNPLMSKRIISTIDRYFVLSSPSINFVSANWAKTVANSGESVNFTVRISNPYRTHETQGTLSVEVWEDYGYGNLGIKLMRTYPFSVSLTAEQSLDFTNSYQVFRSATNKGFLLKVFWEGSLVYWMENAFPPRLYVNFP